jgi:hypothetical protein
MRRAITRDSDNAAGWRIPSFSNHTRIRWQTLHIRKEEEPYT